MRRTKRGGWPYSQPPNVLFMINRAPPQARGLVAWWPTLGSRGADVLRDFSGYGHHAPLEANATWLNTPQLGFALDTSGDGAAIVPEGNNLDPPQGSITLSVWIHYATSEPNRHIISKVDLWGVNTQRWLLKFQYTNIQWGSTHGTTTFSGAASVGALVLYTLTDDGTNARLYKNGLLFGSGASLTFDNDTGARVALGKAVQVGNYIDGWLADPRIYNRALSDAEVYELYRNPWELYKPLMRRVWALSPGGVVVTGTASITGSGALTAAGLGIVLASSALSGDGALSAAGLGIVLASSALAGEGTLTATALNTVLAMASVSGAGTLTADGLAIVLAAAGLTGAGALAASGLPIVPGVASLGGTGALSATGLNIVLGASALTGEGALDAAAMIVVLGSGSLSGDGTLAASALLIILGAAALTGSGELSAVGSLGGVTPTARTYITDAERRSWTISTETRVFIVATESRILEV